MIRVTTRFPKGIYERIMGISEKWEIPISAVVRALCEVVVVGTKLEDCLLAEKLWEEDKTRSSNEAMLAAKKRIKTEMPERVWELRKGGYTIPAIAKQLGISSGIVCRILDEGRKNAEKGSV